MDPRLAVIDKRMNDVKNIIAVSGGKGGVGKTSAAVMLALNLSAKGFKTGLLDLDLSGHSSHFIINSDKNIFPEEDKGLVPPEISGIKYMSVYYFNKNGVTPFRGEDISNAIIELLTITIWKDLDYLVIDMPPGIGDAVLDAIRLLKKISFMLIATKSILSREILKREISILQNLQIPTKGILINLCDTFQETDIAGVPILGCIPFDCEYENAIGNVDKLKETKFYSSIGNIVQKLNFT